MLKLLDLFSGIGGFSLGLERTGGFETVAFCEIDKFCQKVLRKHWPNVRQYTDIKNLTAAQLTADGITVDAICGGFPCQDISTAGGGQEWAKAHAADYGQNTPVLLASYDHATQSWRTSQHCLVEGLTVFSETWPRSGTMQSGIAYRLQALVRLTDETGFGLWLTPRASDTSTGEKNETFLTRMGDRTDRCAQSLPAQVNNPKTWPTPRAAYSQGSTGGANRSSDLRDFVKMYPTPTVCGNYNRKGASKTSGDGLATAVGGTLNPTWVEWLMGFPIGWTDLNHSATP